MKEVALALNGASDSKIWSDDVKFLNLSSKAPSFASNTFFRSEEGYFFGWLFLRKCFAHSGNTSTTLINVYQPPLLNP